MFKTTAEQNITSKSLITCSRDIHSYHGIYDQRENLSRCISEGSWTYSPHNQNVCNYSSR